MLNINNNQIFNYDNILSYLPGRIYWKNLNGEYLGCNDNQLKYLGLSSFEEYIGKNDFDFFPKRIAEVLSASSTVK